MGREWTSEKLQSYIDNGVQEDLHLDYKAADALAKTDGKKREIHKDVSAMANSAGGTIIYGISEFNEPERKHLPECFDPVDQTVFTKESLEQIINGIQPRIQNIVITPVPIEPDSNNVIFVVEVPRSNTVHQASDKRYYKRFNFSSVPMEDYEIRDVMNRNSHALIDLEFELEFEICTVSKERHARPSGSLNNMASSGGLLGRTEWYESEEEYTRIRVYAQNNGAVYAQNIVGFLYVPKILLNESEVGEEVDDGYLKLRFDNNRETSAGAKTWQTHTIPVLPGLKEQVEVVLINWFYGTKGPAGEIRWEVVADNATPRRGAVQLEDLRANSKNLYTRSKKGLLEF